MNEKRKAPVGVGTPSEAMFESTMANSIITRQTVTCRDIC